MDQKPGPKRLSIFSDGVFAIIITILVLELRPPESASFSALVPLWPTALGYAVSYLFLAIVWVNHHHLLRYAETVTPHPSCRSSCRCGALGCCACLAFYVRPEAPWSGQKSGSAAV